jgi:hypothetical protein
MLQTAGNEQVTDLRQTVYMQRWLLVPKHLSSRQQAAAHIAGSSSAAVEKLLIRGYAAFSFSWFCVQINIFNRLGSFGSVTCDKKKSRTLNKDKRWSPYTRNFHSVNTENIYVICLVARLKEF